MFIGLVERRPSAARVFARVGGMALFSPHVRQVAGTDKYRNHHGMANCVVPCERVLLAVALRATRVGFRSLADHSAIMGRSDESLMGRGDRLLAEHPMRFVRRRARGVWMFVLAAAVATVFSAPALAAEPGAGLDVTDVSKWPLDKITRTDHRTFEGLIRHEDARQIELVEVGRRPGKPMFLTVRPINVADVAKVERLSPADREVLKNRIDAFRNRTAILASLVADVRLVVVRPESKARSLHYEGPWFALDSTANERITREAIVRIEQTFAGYRTLLRPRRDPPRPLGILLFG
jgi:hypothetical protein